MMCLTEQKTERLIKLSKKDLIMMLEPYTDESLICIGLQMQQGYVGFFDLEQDTRHKDKYEFVLNSDCFNEWYKKDITELKEKIDEQQVTIEQQENEIEKLKVEKQMLEKVISNNLSDFKNGGWHRIRDLR